MTDVTLTALETVVLVDADAGSRVVIAPKRGGMVTRFDVRGQAVLFLDQSSLIDETKNVRGGVPVLFPSPGPLKADHFTSHGRSGSMTQHGFARQRAWSPTTTAVSSTEIALELAADDATRAVFPWDFRVTIRYALAGAKLTVATTIENRDRGTMPFALGFHPYFFVPDAEKASVRISTLATRAYDNVTKTMTELHGPLDLTKKEVDLHLVDHRATHATLEREIGNVVVSGDPELGRWVVWTLAGKDFVCLEPWTAPADALNSGENLLTLAPGARKTLTMTIELVAKARA